MRIFIDEAGMDWDEAWSITTRSVAYTNHCFGEALERWPQDLVAQLLPRIWQILMGATAVGKSGWRFTSEGRSQENGLSSGAARVPGWQNLCIAGGMAVNGVGAHTALRYFEKGHFSGPPTAWNPEIYQW